MLKKIELLSTIQTREEFYLPQFVYYKIFEFPLKSFENIDRFFAGGPRDELSVNPAVDSTNFSDSF